MDFVEALKRIDVDSTDEYVDTIPAKEQTSGKKIRRKSWGEFYGIKYLWVTSVGVLVMSLGKGLSSPLFMKAIDYLANDWEVI
jgi:hypothetical protein